MSSRLGTMLQKEGRQLLRSRRTVLAAAAVPALMLLFVAGGNILTIKLGFGSKPLYLLSSSRAISGSYLLRHYSLPVLVTISAMVTPSIVLGDLIFGERERGTIDLLIGLPVTALDVVLAKLIAVGIFAVAVTVPIFALNTVLVSASGFGSTAQTASLLALLGAAIMYSASSSLLIALLAGESRAANILSGLVLGPVVPFEGLVLAGAAGTAGITACAVALGCVAGGMLAWSSRLLSYERLAGAG